MDIKNNFHPMPKRFMVWDKKRQSFVEWCGENIFDLYTLSDLLDCYSSVEFHEDLVIIQSTNLFDKDGEEIFEGSILQEPDGSVSVVEYDGDEAMFRTRTKSILDDMSCGGDYFELIGHILSNPELLEEK